MLAAELIRTLKSLPPSMPLEYQAHKPAAC
jgi:hypothetical protein